jgi:Domain of unknown function (DUF5679)
MKDEKQVTLKNGRPAISGTCTVCGTKMFKIGGGGSTAKPLPRIKAASKQSAKKRTNKAKTKTKTKIKRK